MLSVREMRGSLEVLSGECSVEVLVLFFKGQHQSLETRIYLSVHVKAVFGDDSIDKLAVFGVILAIVLFAEVVDPIVLGIVLDVGVHPVDFLYD